MKNIRNFCIIAHIDHGKSTLADRLLEYTGTVSQRDLQAQVLDDMDLERERGITIKSHAIQMKYKHNGEEYTLNLIDTPGHVDFSYEVSRSIAACEGALLIVDATQGIQAQTISNLYLAMEHDLAIIPVLNKMDLANAMPEEVKDQIVDLVGCKREEIMSASGKTGLGVPELLQAIVERIPAPQGNADEPLQALIFDSVFNSFRGIISYFRIMNGTLRKGDKVKFFHTGKEYDAEEVGVLGYKPIPLQEVSAGNVGYIISGIKTSVEVKVGDTITHVDKPCKEAIDGFENVKPMVFAGVYPVSPDDYEDLRASIEKLQLNDASLTYEPESSVALGFGFRCGFLGLLHMEIIQERLEREFNMDVITTVPNVSYKVTTTKGEVVEIHNPSGLPAPNYIDHIDEPYIRAPQESDIHYHRPHRTDVRDAAFRNRVRLLRPAQEHFERLCLVRLLSLRLPAFQIGQTGNPAQRRYGGCPFHADLPRQRLCFRAAHVRKTQGFDSAPAVRYRRAGGHRKQDYRARNHQGGAQGRNGQMLWRRHFA